MKKMISIVLATLIALSLCACETREEKALRANREAAVAYENEVRKLEAIERELEYVQWQIEQAEKSR